MNAKHTPGPWKLLKAAPRDVVTACGEDREFGVASIVPSVTRIEQRANARLIAAAPELLEALTAICDMQRGNYGNGVATHIKLSDLCDVARTVIAKATGDAP